MSVCFRSLLEHFSAARATLTLAVIFAAASLSACQIVALSGLERVEETGTPTYRQIPASDDSAYLRAPDIVTLTPTSGTILVSAACGGAPSCPNQWMPAAPVAQGQIARIPVSTLSCMQEADVVVTLSSGATKTASINLQPGSKGGSSCILFSSEHWMRASELQRRFARSGLPVELAISRVPSVKVLPGDRIDTDVRFQVGKGSGADNDDAHAPQVLQSSHNSSVLEGSGLIQIDAPAAVQPLPEGTDPRGRVAYALGSNAQLSVRVWKSDACSASQPSLSDVAICLSGSWAPTDNAAKARQCATQVGVDGSQRNAAEGNTDWLNASYHLEAVQTWTLVGEDGVAHQQTYAGPISVSKVVGSAYRALYGRDVLRTPLLTRRAFITVVPSANRCSAEQAPLSGLAELGQPSSLDSVALLPGDSVHVTYLPPAR